MPAFVKAKRNEACPCNRGKKFKHCHGQTDECNKIFKSFQEIPVFRRPQYAYLFQDPCRINQIWSTARLYIDTLRLK